MQEEFYAVTFRKKVYGGSLEDLQKDLDEWLVDYNHNRPHSGRYCYGKTPHQTWLDSLHLARVKLLGEAKVSLTASQAFPSLMRAHAVGRICQGRRGTSRLFTLDKLDRRHIFAEKRERLKQRVA